MLSVLDFIWRTENKWHKPLNTQNLFNIVLECCLLKEHLTLAYEICCDIMHLHIYVCRAWNQQQSTYFVSTTQVQTIIYLDEYNGALISSANSGL